MTTPFWIVDAFAARPFAGNPAAVVLLGEPAPEPWMQALAAEFNLSETAFLVPGADAWTLRWFTPRVEVDLCGHATLASAAVLHHTGAPSPLRFRTRSGELRAGVDGGRPSIDLPVDPVQHELAVRDVASALGLYVVAAARTRGYVLVELADAAAVRSYVPDLSALQALHRDGVVLTAAGEDDVEAAVVSRMFAPGVGIDEDPVTGSAHCALAAWWGDRVGASFLAEQASSRGGLLDVALDGDRVHLAGDATIVAEGRLHAAP